MKKKNNKNSFFYSIIFIILVIISAGAKFTSIQKNENNNSSNVSENTSAHVSSNAEISGNASNDVKIATNENQIDISSIPDYNQSHKQDIEINNNTPYFENELTTEDFERYSELDDVGKGRAHTAFVNVTKSTMPADGVKRETLTYNPTGWNQVMYGKNKKEHLYERCHLIAWSLSNENNNPKNLITGTSKLNEIMIPYENEIREWINAQYKNGNTYHVMYRVTPIYEGDNLLAKGVELEAQSVENGVGDPIKFNRFIYNVQDNFKIDYKTGVAEIINN